MVRACSGMMSMMVNNGKQGKKNELSFRRTKISRIRYCKNGKGMKKIDEKG